MIPAAATLSPGSAGYPDLLASIPDAPARLHALGRLEAPGGLALVGSRRPTPYGLRVARRLAAEAAAAGIPTVSGLARGIDTEVHRATLEAGGATWAVLGSGLDRPYPPENAGLLAEIVRRGGAVVTEVPFGGPPLAANFPRRNRIISGLSWAVVVIEGRSRSGALITARCGLEQGREVLAVPGPVDSALSEAPNMLLREGAAPVGGLADVLAQCPPLRPQARGSGRAWGETGRPGETGGPGEAGGPASGEEREVLDLLASDTVHIETLMGGTGWAVERLLRVLTELELKGAVCALPGQCYARI